MQIDQDLLCFCGFMWISIDLWKLKRVSNIYVNLDYLYGFIKIYGGFRKYMWISMDLRGFA